MKLRKKRRSAIPDTAKDGAAKHRLFAEEEEELSVSRGERPEDVLDAAIRAQKGRGTAVPRFADPDVTEDFDLSVLNALDPDDLDVTDVDTRPDPDVYEDAMQHIIDGERTRDITIAGTDADLVTFLRAKASPEADEKNAEAADREFLGIGYLFSEAEYEAIMAQYNEDGSQSPVYDTETRAFDQVGSKE